MQQVLAGSRSGRVVALVALLLALLVALAACGQDGGGASDGEPTTPPQPTGEPSPTEETEGEGRTTVSVFFPREGHGDPCGDVYPVSRDVAAEDPIGEALVALLAGPTEAEQAEGYGGWFSEETAGLLRGYRAENGVLYVDFDEYSTIIPNASTSCGSAILLAQLNETLGQFPDVGEPRYSFEGDVAAFYEWLQLVPPDGG